MVMVVVVAAVVFVMSMVLLVSGLFSKLNWIHTPGFMRLKNWGTVIQYKYITSVDILKTFPVTNSMQH